jgi:transketolase
MVKNKKVRVVSMMCRELFLEQEKSFREQIIPASVKTVVMEAGVTFGWEAVTGCSENIIGINRFGASDPGTEVAKHLKLVPEELAKLM